MLPHNHIIYRIAVLADIHGNLPAFEAVLTDLQSHGPLDGLLVAGDIICGPDQQEILRRLIDLRAVMIQGNNEAAVLRMLAGDAPDWVYTAKQYALRRWSCEHLTPPEIDFLRTLPEQAIFNLPGADPIRLVHGSPRSITELVLPARYALPLEQKLGFAPLRNPNQLTEIFALVPEPVLVFGHTHLPWSERQNRRLALNPGAVSFPENGFAGAQYALLNWDGAGWTPEFHALPYDREAFRRANIASGFLDTGILARIFMEEALSGKDIMPAFFALTRRLAEQAGCAQLPYFPDEIWEQAEQEFVFPPSVLR